MSRVQDALKQASEEREIRHGASSQAHDKTVGTQELWQEVHRLESSLASWSAARQASLAQSAASAGRPAAPAASQPACTWKETLTQCERQLSVYDEQLVRRLEEQATLEAQVETQERAAAQAASALASLRHHLTDTQRAVQSVEAEKASVRRKVDVLRECQKLSDASAAAQQELQATDEMIARTADYQQRVAEKIAQYRQHRQTAQRTAEGLRHQLQQALARVETNGAPGDAAHE